MRQTGRKLKPAPSQPAGPFLLGERSGLRLFGNLGCWIFSQSISAATEPNKSKLDTTSRSGLCPANAKSAVAALKDSAIFLGLRLTINEILE
jgi:hypothetical protein